MEVFYIYFRAGRVEEPYVSITKKRQMPKDGYSEEIEKEVGQAEGKLCTHRSAFSRASVIQAFLGSAPQLTLQLYICVLQQEITAARSRWTCYYHLCVLVGGRGEGSADRCNCPGPEPKFLGFISLIAFDVSALKFISVSSWFRLWHLL